jgi:hypothetical protein
MINVQSVQSLGILDSLEKFALKKGHKISDYVVKKGDSIIGKRMVSEKMLTALKSFHDNSK